jgi:hypothetical protein
MYTLTILNKQSGRTSIQTFTTLDFNHLELHLNVLRSIYSMPEFEERQDGSFISQNCNYTFFLEEEIYETPNTEENGSTYF